MAAVTIRKISEETHRAIKVRAKAKGRSAEAEMRAILDEAVRPEERVGLGSALAEFGKKYAEELAGVDFEVVRDQAPETKAMLLVSFLWRGYEWSCLSSNLITQRRNSK